MKKNTLTDRDMLRAAERALGEHRATRPATPTEASAIAAAHRAEAEALIRQAAALEARRRPTADEIGRGPHAIEHGHEASREITRGLHAAGRLRQLALAPALRAAAWDAISDRPDVAWLATEAALVARGEYYRRIVGSSDGTRVVP